MADLSSLVATSRTTLLLCDNNGRLCDLWSTMAQLRKEHSALVSGEPDEVLQRLATAIAGLPKYTFAAGGPGTLVITREYYGTGRVLAAIFLFPIGLIALASKSRETVSAVAVPDSPGRTCLTVSGVFTGRLIDVINSIID